MPHASGGHQHGEESRLPGLRQEKEKTPHPMVVGARLMKDFERHDEKVNTQPKPGHFTGHYLGDHHLNIHDACMTVVEEGLGWDESHPHYLPLGYAALRHDRPKMLEKYRDLYLHDGRLTAEQLQIMRGHPEEAADDLKHDAEMISEGEYREKLLKAVPLVRCHDAFWLIKEEELLEPAAVLFYVDRRVSRMERRGNHHLGEPQEEAFEWIEHTAIYAVPAEHRARTAPVVQRVAGAMAALFSRQPDGTVRKRINLRRNAPR